MAAVEEHTHVKDVAKDSRIVDTIAVLPVRNLIVYPHMAAPLVANRPGSIKALDEALQQDKQVMILAQRDPEVDRPTPDDLYKVGTLTKVHKAMRLPEDSLYVVVQGMARARVLDVLETDPVLRVRVELLPEQEEKSLEVQAMAQNLSDQFQKLVGLVNTMSDELKIPAINLEDQPS